MLIKGNLGAKPEFEDHEELAADVFDDVNEIKAATFKTR